MDQRLLMLQELSSSSSAPFLFGEPLSVAVLLPIFFLLAALFLWLYIRTRSDTKAHRELERHLLEQTQKVAELMKMHDSILCQLKMSTELSVKQQGDLSRSFNERLDKVTNQVGKNLIASNLRMSESLSKLRERLVAIDSAQSNIAELSAQFVSLKDILSDKQQRGAFGQGRMEAIVADALPQSSFSFQATLPNNTRPDCLISLPNTKEKLVIDAKFPLESFRAMKKSRDETTQKQAKQRFRQDVVKHIKDIHERYLIPGETQDTAIMFIPSESIYAELYEHFEELIQKSYRLRVIIVSPSMLTLAIQLMQSLVKDARVREQAHFIRDAVASLTNDARRLRERTCNLKRHFDQVSQDVEKVIISSGKLAKNIEKIENIPLERFARTLEPDQPPASAQRILCDADRCAPAETRQEIA